MGVKSTVEIGRMEAVKKAVELSSRLNWARLAAPFMLMSDRDLEDELVRLNDKAAGGEGFENYQIVDD